MSKLLKDIGQARWVQAVVRLPKDLWNARWVLVLVTLITLLMRLMHWFSLVEFAQLDNFLLMCTPKQAEKVVLVELGPFDLPEPDAEKLYQIVDVVARGSPRVIAVDLDTASRVYNSMRISSSWPRTVWSRNAWYDWRREVWQIDDVLGSQQPQPPLTGLAMMPLDSDRVVRKHSSFIQVQARPQESIEQVVVDEIRGKQSQPRDVGGGETVADPSYAFDWYRYTDIHKVSLSKGFALDGPLKGRIVVLGKAYPQARDVHETPFGPRYGMELVASAIEADLRPDGEIRPINELWAVATEIMGGMLLIVLFCLWSYEVAFRLSIVLIPILAFGGSWLTFSYYGLWLNFVPILLGVLMHLLFHHQKTSLVGH